MSRRLLLLTLGSAILMTACATNQENPYYKYSSQYKNAPVTTIAQAPGSVETLPVSFEPLSNRAPGLATYTRVNHECLKSEKNHELLGAGIGGAIGAIAGEKLIGGTKGTLIGAGLGGAAGYGIGDKVVNCDPEPIVTTQSAPIVSQAYISPTDTEFATISDTGTPGYQVLQAQTQTPEVSQEAFQEVYGVATPVILHETGQNAGAQEVSYDYGSNIITASAATNAISGETRTVNTTGYGAHVVKEGDTVYSLSRKLCVGVGDIQSLNSLNANYGINIGDQLRLPASQC